jgi:superfamily II DNA/RNA helicase
MIAALVCRNFSKRAIVFFEVCRPFFSLEKRCRVALRDIDLRISPLTLYKFTLILRLFTVYAVQTKKEAHRFYAVLTQLNVKSCELHGDVTQALRYLALQRFRDNEVDVMVRITADRRSFLSLLLSSVISRFHRYHTLRS